MRISLLLAISVLAACATRPQQWGGAALTNPELIAREISPELVARDDTLQALAIPAPTGLRPCCAFGSRLRVSIGGLTVPGVEIVNTVGVDDLGLHKYDNGALALQASRPGAPVINDERNGLLYTCRGGFIDTAHVRDWADMTLFLSVRIGQLLETGGTIGLPDEGATRQVIVQPMRKKLIDEYGRARLAVPMAQWAAFQLSVWHEIVTWYGWSATGVFSEQASSFSPEDLYSNLLGIKLAGVLIYDGAVGSEVLYNESMNVALRTLLPRLGAVPGKVAREAAQSIDGVWWNSELKLPENDLVIRRNFSIGPKVTPWLVTQSKLPRALAPGVAARCGETPRPVPLRLPETVAGAPISKRVTVAIDVAEQFSQHLPSANPHGRTITQEDFPRLIGRIRTAAGEKFGPGFDKP